MIEIEGMDTRAINRSQLEASIVSLKAKTASIVDSYENRINYLEDQNKKLGKRLNISILLNLISCAVTISVVMILVIK